MNTIIRKTVFAVFLIFLITLAISTIVQSSRKLAGKIVQEAHATSDTAATLVTDPRSEHVLMGSAGAQMSTANSDHEREPRKESGALTNVRLSPLQPLDHAVLIAGQPVVDFSWSEIESAARYRLEVEEAQGKAVLSAVLLPGVGQYRVPSWRLDGRDQMRWRVVALDQQGQPIADTPWRILLPLSSDCEN
jgi:hypothetical protein